MVVVQQQNGTNQRDYIDPMLKTEKKLGDIEKTEEYSKVISNNVEIKVFKRRWLQLALFVFYSTSNNAQTFQYTIIRNIMCRYYNVSNLAMDWTSLIYMSMYLVLVFPASYLMDRVGLKWTVLVGTIITCVGSWIKYFSAPPDRFAGVFLGQSLTAMSQVVALSVPGRLAAYWFGCNEVATATAIGCVGMQIGNSLCYLITTIFIRNHENLEDIREELSSFLFAVAIACTVVTVSLILFFQDEPLLPPSDNRARSKANREMNKEPFLPQVKRILGNRSFVLLWNSYGMQLSILAVLGTLMNPLYLAHFKNGEKDVGRMGVLATFMGGVGSAGAAYVLDKTQKFKTITVVICVCCIFAEIALATSFMLEIRWLVYLNGVLLGTCLVGYSTMGLELCVEMTYPESEGTAIAILNMSNQIYGTLLILICSPMIETYGDKAGHACILVTLIIGTILNSVNRGELRRQKAAKISGYADVPLHALQPVKA